MLVPAEVIADGDTEILSAVNNFRSVTMEPIFSMSLVSFIGDDADDLAFLRVELHLQISFPFLQGLKILLD